MIPVQIRITKKLIDIIDELIECGIYSNRSQAIRDAVRRNVTYYYRIDVIKGDKLPLKRGIHEACEHETW